MGWIIFILYSAIFGFATSYIANEKGKDQGTWFLIGALLGIIGLLIIGFSKDALDSKETRDNEKWNIKRHLHKSNLIENKTFNLTTNTKSPIDILWNSINVDKSEIVLYSKIKNISNKQIESIIYDVECFNSFDKPVNDDVNNVMENTIQDLKLLPNETLSPELFIDLSHLPSTRKVNIIIKDVLFANGDIWYHDEKDLIDTELNPIKNENDLSLIRNFNGKDVLSLFELKDDRWICICGRNNSTNLKTCSRCERDKDEMISSFSVDEIEDTINRYKKKEESIKKDKLKRLERDEKLKEKRKAKRNKVLLLVILVTGLIISTYYITQVFLPQQKLAKINELYKDQEYGELLQLYEKTIVKTGVNGDMRKGILKLANKYAEMNNYKDLNNAISLLKNSDDKYKLSYELIVDEYHNENYKVVSQLVSKMNEGYLESGQIMVETTLIVGVDLRHGLMYSPHPKYKQKVNANKLMEYNEGQLIDKNTYEFQGADFGGTAIGWSSNSYLYIGETVDGKLEGKGSLYINGYKYDAYTFVKHYEGEFKDGRYEGDGVVFWDEPKNKSSHLSSKNVTSDHKIVETKNPLIIASFKEGVVEGEYKRYYSDGTFNDSGKVHNGVQDSSKYGIEDNSDTYSDVELPKNIEIVD